MSKIPRKKKKCDPKTKQKNTKRTKRNKKTKTTEETKVERWGDHGCIIV
jgi:hypothetical protein